MFVLNIRGLWFIGIIAGILGWVAYGDPIPAAWSSTPPDGEEIPYVTLWEPMIKRQLFADDGISYDDPDYIGARDLESEHGYDPDE